MTNKPAIFPKATRPLEYVGLFIMEFLTKEGVAYVYMAVDAYSEFAFITGVEKDNSPDNIVKHIYILTEHPEFIKKMHKGFTLVMANYEELETRIISIIGSNNGKVIFDEALNRKIILPAKMSLEKIRNQT